MAHVGQEFFLNFFALFRRVFSFYQLIQVTLLRRNIAHIDKYGFILIRCAAFKPYYTLIKRLEPELENRKVKAVLYDLAQFLAKCRPVGIYRAIYNAFAYQLIRFKA